MIRRAAVCAAGLLFGLAASPAMSCPDPITEMLAHSCWNDTRIDVLLLPEDKAALNLDGPAIAVTGGYTDITKRAGGDPKPVGLFLWQGSVINHVISKMDGVLLVAPGHAPSVQHRERIILGGKRYDLTDPAQRKAFVGAAKRLKVSMFQSHLLIVDRRIDVRPPKVSRKAVRRLLIEDSDGLALVQTPRPMTLFAAANWAAMVFRPRMALNLDMGTYDYCMRHVGGAVKKCGRVTAGGVAILSNVLKFRARSGE